MNSDLLNTIILASAFLGLFAVAELFYHKFKVRAELTRKLVHAGTGLLVLLFPVMLGNHWLVLLLCSVFACLLIGSQKYHLLKSVNAIDRESVGSLAYPVSVYLCYLAFDLFGQKYIIFYIPILVLAICDPVAALTGKRWPYGKYKVGNNYKTLLGSAMFFITAFILVWLLLNFSVEESSGAPIFVKSLIVALFSMLAEAFSRNGYDNLFIPVVVLITLILIN